MKNFENEVEFKKYLDTLGVRYGELDNTWKFYIEFIDNKGASLLTYAIAKTPVLAIRSLPSILEKMKLPIEDIDIVVRFAFNQNSETIEFVPINSVISPYFYFKKQEISPSAEIVENKE